MYRHAYRNTAISSGMRLTRDGNIVGKYDFKNDCRTRDELSRTEYADVDGAWVMTRRWEEGKGITFTSKKGPRKVIVQDRKLPKDLCGKCFLERGKCYC